MTNVIQTAYQKVIISFIISLTSLIFSLGDCFAELATLKDAAGRFVFREMAAVVSQTPPPRKLRGGPGGWTDGPRSTDTRARHARLAALLVVRVRCSPSHETSRCCRRSRYCPRRDKSRGTRAKGRWKARRSRGGTSRARARVHARPPSRTLTTRARTLDTCARWESLRGACDPSKKTARRDPSPIHLPHVILLRKEIRPDDLVRRRIVRCDSLRIYSLSLLLFVSLFSLSTSPLHHYLSWRALAPGAETLEYARPRRLPDTSRFAARGTFEASRWTSPESTWVSIWRRHLPLPIRSLTMSPPGITTTTSSKPSPSCQPRPRNWCTTS